MYGTQRPQSDSAMQKRTHGSARGGCTILLRNELESGTPQRQRCTYWLHYAEGSAMPPLLLSLVFARLPPAVCRRRITAVAANKSAPSDRQTPRIRWATNKLPPSQMIGQQASPQSISYRLKTAVRV